MSQIYNFCEIKENNGKNGKPVWIVVKDAVYNVSKFLKDHPGGADAIIDYAGKDATKAFNQVGHSTDAIRDMKLYKIGTVSTACLAHLKSSGETVAISAQPKSMENIYTNAQTPPPQQQCCGKTENKSFKIFCCH